MAARRRVASRFFGFVVLSALALGSLLGCEAVPEPTPTLTPAFSSEEDAFTAAEEVYRAYNDAVNAKRGGDTATDPTVFLTGQILEEEIAAADELEAAHISLTGLTAILSFDGVSADLSGPVAEVVTSACLDISNVRALDSTGADVTAAGRSDVYAVEVHLSGARESLLISEYEVRTDLTC